MGLFQNLLETYEKCSAAVGIVQVDADGNANEKKTLLPVLHTTFESHIAITLDEHGNFIDVTRDNKATTIIIPCTVDSEGRSGKACFPHPLCDKLEYLGTLDARNLERYLEQVLSWKEVASGDSKIMLNSIYTYISRRTLCDDLFGNNIFEKTECECDTIGNLNFKKKKNSSGNDEIIVKNLGVRFVIQGTRNFKVWEEKALRQSWIDYIKQSETKATVNLFDYLSGEKVEIVGRKHPKKINRATSNAKLISCNEKVQDADVAVVFKGRFTTQDDAVVLDLFQSARMHQMLRWLIANYGYAVDSQVIITWAVDSNTEVKVKSQDDSFEVFCEMEKTITQDEILTDAAGQVYGEYAVRIRNLLQGFGNADKAKQHARKICIAAFDAATSGRMGLVFYQELVENEYLQSIVEWHHDTSYYLTAWRYENQGRGKDKAIPVHYIGAPSYDDILYTVYGKGHGDKGYDVLKKKVRKQLLECMFGDFPFPRSMVEMAAVRASHPMSFSDSDGRFIENDWRRSINITCALVRKYHKQQFKEELSMTLDEMQKDRSYLYGRWLAVADKVEEAALRSQGRQKERVTNAVRYTSSYSVKPFTTKLLISEQLNPYRNQINSLYKNFFLPIITEIDEKLEVFTDNNERLSALYLLGYSAQYKALSKSSKNDNMEVNDNGDTEEQD